MTSYKISGNAGEDEVVELVRCPNCGRRLMRLPESFPISDVLCTGCQFRAQIKTTSSKLRSVIRSSGWDIVEKSLKAGYLMPPLITNSKWTDKQGAHHEIRMYPFVPPQNLRIRVAHIKGRGDYNMYDFVGLDALPYFILYQK